MYCLACAWCVCVCRGPPSTSSCRIPNIAVEQITDVNYLQNPQASPRPLATSHVLKVLQKP